MYEYTRPGRVKVPERQGGGWWVWVYVQTVRQMFYCHEHHHQHTHTHTLTHAIHLCIRLYVQTFIHIYVEISGTKQTKYMHVHIYSE